MDIICKAWYTGKHKTITSVDVFDDSGLITTIDEGQTKVVYGHEFRLNNGVVSTRPLTPVGDGGKS